MLNSAIIHQLVKRRLLLYKNLGQWVKNCCQQWTEKYILTVICSTAGWETQTLQCSQVHFPHTSQTMHSSFR